MRTRRFTGRLGLCLVVSMLAAVPRIAHAGGADALRVGTVVAPSGNGTVRVPVYLKDVAGTPLGIDQPFGRHIVDIAFDVVYGPNPCVDTVFPVFDTAAGVLAHQPTYLLVNPGVPHVSQGFVAAYAEYKVPIPFTGSEDLLGELVFELHDCGTAPIPLVLEPWLCTLASQTNVFEGTDTGTLALEDGWILQNGVPIPTATPASTPSLARSFSPDVVAIPAAGGRSLALLAIALAVAGSMLVRRLG
jgi:hypothetical protein